MKSRIISEDIIRAYQQYLIEEEKSTATVEKYLRDVRAFYCYTQNEEITKETVIRYKKELQAKGYATRSINSMLAAINSFLIYMGWSECRVKILKLQKQIYCAKDKELTKSEYERLLKAANKNVKLRLVMQTICSSGIRVSELRFFTVDAVRHGEITVNCKGKTRIILIPGKLRKLLLCFASANGIKKGMIFLTKKGMPLNRKMIWALMKGLCKKAGVKSCKVFPHNLRKLFARTFYRIEGDIAKLADVLGHSSIETTRIYIMSSGIEHQRKIEMLGLL